MEAMGCGVVPVCKSINSGVPELVHDGITGLLTNGPEGLLSKIEYLKHNAGKWEDISLNCQKLINDQFSSDKNLASWIKLFNDLAGMQKKTIAIPSRLNLPPAHPYFAGLDRREPPMLVKAYKKLKRILHN
jgi:hypothetical protein